MFGRGCGLRGYDREGSLSIERGWEVEEVRWEREREEIGWMEGGGKEGRGSRNRGEEGVWGRERLRRGKGRR